MDTTDKKITPEQLSEIHTEIRDVEPDTVSVKGFQLTSIVGMTKEAAITTLETNKREWRLAQEDGDTRLLTDDIKTGRVNLFIERGKVSSYRLG
jgi:hypothetical protein